MVACWAYCTGTKVGNAHEHEREAEPRHRPVALASRNTECLYVTQQRFSSVIIASGMLHHSDGRGAVNTCCETSSYP